MAKKIKANPARKSINNAPKKKEPKEPGAKNALVKKILIGLAIGLSCIIIVVVMLGAGLFFRISRPGSAEYNYEDETTPTATQSAVLPVSTQPPSPTPSIASPDNLFDAIPETGEETDEDIDPLTEFGDLPLNDIYPQSQLSAAQIAAMDAQNKDKKNFINVLLIGMDRRGSQGSANADTLMIATLDKHNGRLKLTSILRDCFLPIKGYEPDRLNSALAKGGVPLLMETINESFMMDLTNYVMVDFRMFERIINKMGGIGVNMTAAEISAANDNIAGLNKQWGVEYLWDGFIFAEAGGVRLNGKQALGYARIRHLDSDFVRTNRQFKVLSAILAKFRSKNPAEQYALLYDLLPMVETDLSALQIVDIGTAALTMDTPGMLHSTLPFDGYYKSGSYNRKSAIALDIPMSAWLLHRFIYIDTSIPGEAKNYSGGPSLPPRTPSPFTPAPEGYEGIPEYTQNTMAPTPIPTPTPYSPYITWRSGPPTPPPAG